MMKKKLSLVLKIIFWITPFFFWFGWELILVYPRALGLLIIASLVLLVPVVYEAVGRRFQGPFVFIFISAGLLLSSFYLFISLLSVTWVVQLAWPLLVWYLYRYFLAVKQMAITGDTKKWAEISLFGSLVTIFFVSASLFGLQAFLSLSPWPLLAIFAVISFASMWSLAFSQGWNRPQDFWLWPLSSLMISEIALMFTLLPLNYLIAGILCALAYYSVLNFIRLYLNNNLSARKIKNYALFTAISLIIILLTARWL